MVLITALLLLIVSSAVPLSPPPPRVDTPPLSPKSRQSTTPIKSPAGVDDDQPVVVRGSSQAINTPHNNAPAPPHHSNELSNSKVVAKVIGMNGGDVPPSVHLDDMYSTIHCIDGGTSAPSSSSSSTPPPASAGKYTAPFEGSAHQYGFPIVNRSCFYTNVLYRHPREFSVFIPDTPRNRQLHRAGKLIPPVTLASRPYDLPAVKKAKQHVIKGKIGWTYGWRPNVIFGPIPPVSSKVVDDETTTSSPPPPTTGHPGSSSTHDELVVEPVVGGAAAAGRDATGPSSIRGIEGSVIGYYTPIVAPWNYAHTLYCDLFGLFWAASEFVWAGRNGGIGGGDASPSWHWHFAVPTPGSTTTGLDAEEVKGGVASWEAPRSYPSSSTTTSTTKSALFKQMRILGAYLLGRRDEDGTTSSNDIPNPVDRPLLDMQVVATSSHYDKEYPLPDPKKPNRAFDMFSRRTTIYDLSLKHNTLYRGMVAGAGTKSWSWVTDRYAASGSGELWSGFRTHLIDVVGAVDRKKKEPHQQQSDVVPPSSDPKRRLRVSICHKKDKRGIVNYDEVEAGLKAHFERTKQPVDVVLEAAVGKSAREQVQMMINADVYICNEGTLATSFFLLPEGSAFVSLPLVYHGPHLHRLVGLPRAEHWWKEPDLMRPDPRLNQGGNIDWFPQSIPWVRTFWYDYIPLNETRVQLPLKGLRNYMPDYNIILNVEKRLAPLLDKVVGYLGVVGGSDDGGAVTDTMTSVSDQLITSAKQLMASNVAGGGVSGLSPNTWARVFRFRDALLSGRRDNFADMKLMCSTSTSNRTSTSKAVVDEDHNFSLNGRLCKEMLQLSPEWTAAFNSAKCFYGMSWLCELWSNTRYDSRNFHGKWALSKGRCGGTKATTEYLETTLATKYASLLGGGVGDAATKFRIDPRLHWHTPPAVDSNGAAADSLSSAAPPAFGEVPALRRYHLATRFGINDEPTFLTSLFKACEGVDEQAAIRQLFNLATSPFLFSSFPLSGGPRMMEDFLFFAPSVVPPLFNTTDMRVPGIEAPELNDIFGPYTSSVFTPNVPLL